MVEVRERINLLVKKFFRNKTDFCERLGISMVSVHHWCNRGNIPGKQLTVIMDMCPGLSLDWLAKGEGMMMESEQKVTVVDGPKKLIPFYEEVLVTCGVVEMPVQNETATYINMPGVDAQFLMRASGDSMSPVIEHGDLIGVKEMTTFEGFRDGQAYLIITRDAHCMVKYVKDPGVEVPYLELSSANPEYYMSRSDRELEKESVIKILKVSFVGHVKPF